MSEREPRPNEGPEDDKRAWSGSGIFDLRQLLPELPQGAVMKKHVPKGRREPVARFYKSFSQRGRGSHMPPSWEAVEKLERAHKSLMAKLYERASGRASKSVSATAELAKGRAMRGRAQSEAKAARRAMILSEYERLSQRTELSKSGLARIIAKNLGLTPKSVREHYAALRLAGLL
jgi:hypothetical protein